MTAQVPLLAEMLAEVPDPRQSSGKRYPLGAMLTLACVAVLCVYRSIRAIAEWEAKAYDTEALLERKRTVKAPRRLYGSIDGGRVHIRDESVRDAVWRELKAGAWFVTRAQPPTRPDGEWSIRAENIHYYTDIRDVETFSRLVWSTAVQQHAQLAEELIILSDGARWIWEMVAEHFPQAIQIVDWFHACEYLEAVAKMAFKDETQREAWVGHKRKPPCGRSA